MTRARRKAKALKLEAEIDAALIRLPNLPIGTRRKAKARIVAKRTEAIRLGGSFSQERKAPSPAATGRSA